MSEDREREERRIGARPAVAHEVPQPASVSSVDLRARGSRLWMVLVIVGALAAAAAAALFAFKGKAAADDNARKAGAAAGDGIEPADGTMGMDEARAVIIDGMKEDLGRKPCDQGLALRLASELIDLGRYQEVGDINARFAKVCPEPYPRLLRKAYYAHEQLGQWPQAEGVAGALMKGEPDEGSFWWWRGQARVKQHELAGAAADFRQAMAATPFDSSRGYSLMDFAEIADKVDAACDAAAALRLYQAVNEERAGQRAIDLQTRLHLAGGCDSAYGTGQTAIERHLDRPIDSARVKVGKATGTFLLSPRTGYTLLSRAFADKAGITAAGEPVDTYVAGTLMSGTPAIAPTMATGPASAPAVRVLVVDELPGNLDGALGMSFLLRFDYQELDSQLTLDTW